MRPFSPRNYRTHVTHVPLVLATEDDEDVETWPGAGTELLANVSQANPQARDARSVEETVTAWVLWFPTAALVEYGVPISRGDRLRMTPDYGPEIVLRVAAHATAYNADSPSVMVRAEQIS